MLRRLGRGIIRYERQSNAIRAGSYTPRRLLRSSSNQSDRYRTYPAYPKRYDRGDSYSVRTTFLGGQSVLAYLYFLDPLSPSVRSYSLSVRIDPLGRRSLNVIYVTLVPSIAIKDYQYTTITPKARRAIVEDQRNQILVRIADGTTQPAVLKDLKELQGINLPLRTL